MAANAPDRTPTRGWRPKATITILAILAALVAGATGSTASSGEFISRMNGARSSQGIAGLQAHSELTARAQEWANKMASDGRISHSNVSARVKSDWERLGENVGKGSSVEQVHNMFMNSSAHRANILDSRFQHVGVGTAWRDGQLYVAEIFMRLRSSAPVAAPAPAPRRAAPAAASRSARRTPPPPPPAPPPPPPPPPPTMSSRFEENLARLRGLAPT